MGANENSYPSPIAPDTAVANDGKDLPRVRIENDILGKDEILSHAVCLETTACEQSLWLRDESRRHSKNPLLTRKFLPPMREL